MTEKEKIVIAIQYLQKLSAGVNPLDGTLIPDDEVINNSHISNCLAYVADVLLKHLENPLYSNNENINNNQSTIKTTEIVNEEIDYNTSIDTNREHVNSLIDKYKSNNSILINKQQSKSIIEDLLGSEYISSIKPISISIIVDNINSILIKKKFKKIKTTQVTQWLVNNNILKVVSFGEKSYKISTDIGQKIGITNEQINSSHGKFNIVLYNKSAQDYIIRNIQKIIDEK